MPISIISGGLKPFEPFDLSGCSLWLDSDRDVELDGLGHVSAWRDISGNEADCLQSNADRRPHYNENVLNGHAVINDNLHGDRNLTNASMAGLSNVSGVTIFAVMSSLAGGYVLFVDNPASAFYLQGESDWTCWRQFLTASARGITYTDPSVVAPCIFSNIYDGSKSTDYEKLRMFRNGLFQPLGINSALPTSISIPGYRIGCQSDSDSSFRGGYACFIIYNRALSDVEHNKVIKYLGARYGITVAQSLYSRMTAADAPSPQVASATTGGTTAYKGFNAGENGLGWSSWPNSPSVAVPQRLKIDLGSAKEISHYNVMCKEIGGSPVDWKLRGSGNDSEWTDLDTRTSFTFPSAHVWATSDLGWAVSGSYRYYEIYVTAKSGEGDGVDVFHLALCGPIT